MMIGPEKTALAVRKPDGTIHLEYMHRKGKSGRSASTPFVRGSVRLFGQMVLGVRALLRSADLMEDEDASETETDSAETPEGGTAEVVETAGSAVTEADEKKSEGGDLSLYLSAVAGILVGIGLFILLPNLITGFLRSLLASTASGFGATLLMNLVEGAIRIGLFVGYVAVTALQKDIRRVWMYHGAEHKTIACYEAKLPLTVENVRAFSTRHPRCGTAFLFIVMLISILLFALTGWHAGWINILIRFALVPVIAGIAYEILRWSARHDSWLARWMTKPGLAMQRLTTKEPDDEILEVAIKVMEAVLPEEAEAEAEA